MNIRDKVAVIGAGCCKFGENYDLSTEDMVVAAASDAYADAKVEPSQIQAAWVGTLSSAMAGNALADPLKLFNIPITRVENYCASGMDAFRNACMAVAAGMYDVVLALGFEKLRDSGRSAPPRLFRPDPLLVKGCGLAVTRGEPYLKPGFAYTGFPATAQAAQSAYEQAGMTVKDIDLVECHDCFTITEILNYEDLGLCKKGEGWRYVEEGRASIGGEIPVNPSGGLKSFGHPIGATGIRMIYEVSQHLWNKAGARQGKNAEVGLAHHLAGPGSVGGVTILANG